ncbi:hypothetical protein CSOJ01_03109 [Colletotrichum sojae]|uniref:Uncharacterized protein n=1 Tax=Colletotrichum sojae TaxID=2175907 RepID=A0A8H6N1S7_9PEZI|nr:hypothetical protein CSOJ01_03109 [Colletotrichum sojae]
MQQADAWRRYEAGARSPFLYETATLPHPSSRVGWVRFPLARSELIIIATWAARRREGPDKSAAAPDWAVCEAPALRPWQHDATPWRVSLESGEWIISGNIGMLRL